MLGMMIHCYCCKGHEHPIPSVSHKYAKGIGVHVHQQMVFGTVGDSLLLQGNPFPHAPTWQWPQDLSANPHLYLLLQLNHSLWSTDGQQLAAFQSTIPLLIAGTGMKYIYISFLAEFPAFLQRPQYPQIARWRKKRPYQHSPHRPLKHSFKWPIHGSSHSKTKDTCQSSWLIVSRITVSTHFVHFANSIKGPLGCIALG